MGGTCGTYERQERRIYGFGGDRPEEKGQLERPRREGGDNIKMNPQGVGWECLDWIALALDRDRWQALVNATRTFGFHKMRGIS
jgi:hypothetical protein